MRLVLAATDFPPGRGGIQSYSRSLARALSEEGHDVIVLAAPAAACEAHDRGEGYEIRRPSLGGLWALRIPVFLVSMVRCIKLQSIMAGIATNWYPLGFVMALASGMLPIRTLIVCHGLDVTVWRRSPVLHRLMLFSLRHTHQLATVSNFTKSLLTQQSIPPDRIVVIHPGAPHAEGRSGSGPREEVMLTVCRLVHRKGIDLGIRSLLELCDLPVVFQVVGTGPEARVLKSLAEDLGLASRFALLGDLTDDELRQTYATSRVFLLPSRAASTGTEVEGFGMVLLEAQHHGLPVVATRCGGIPEAFVAEKTGILVPSEDPAAIASAVREITQNPARGMRMGRRGVEWAERHNWHVVAGKIVGLISRELEAPAV